MTADCLLDNTRAIKAFLDHFEGLSCLPFVTDTEMELLYGAEVAAALQDLDRWNRQEGICRGCAVRCCLLVKCELYDKDLNLCPVQSLRPPLCRMHFCGLFSRKYPLLVKGLGDIFLDSQLAAARMNNAAVKMLDCPPLEPAAPDLIKALVSLLDQVKEGRLDESEARELIRERIVGAVC